jgi:hypothetical protein
MGLDLHITKAVGGVSINMEDPDGTSTLNGRLQKATARASRGTVIVLPYVRLHSLSTTVEC